MDSARMSLLPGDDRSMAQLEAKAVAAFLGAAVGDALGWPWEYRVRHAGGKAQERAYSLMFESWIKRSGGRFMPHEEQIQAGEYSDDTQLTLALTRSMSGHTDWWRDFAFVELPLWTLCERGGGAATKRAAATLALGKLPWAGKSKDVEKYFQAGGNGVAMRVLPNAVGGMTAQFTATAWSVMAQGVTTHAHPRGLVGAIAYAFALRLALSSNSPLGYGQLVFQTLDRVSEWAALPNIEDAWSDWGGAADSFSDGNYRRVWDQTVLEMVDLLKICREGMSKGALAVDRATMEKLGCFDPSWKGAGTVAAATAIFLASRYAAAPANGLICAATAHGADTDTIASMTGALLGAIGGSEWVGPSLHLLQDQDYIRGAALRAIRPSQKRSARRRVSQRDLDSLYEALLKLEPRVQLPDGRTVESISKGTAVSRTPGTGVNSWLVRSEDGQTLHIKKVFKNKEAKSSQLSLSEALPDPVEDVVMMSVQVPTRDMARAKQFYVNVLGLKVIKETAKTVNFGALTLRATDSSDVERHSTNIVVFIETKGLSTYQVRLESALRREVPIVISSQGAKSIRIPDPDGNTIELVQR